MNTGTWGRGSSSRNFKIKELVDKTGMRHAAPAEEVAVERGRGVVDGVPVIINVMQCNAVHANAIRID